jgi:hypothetical protein
MCADDGKSFKGKCDECAPDTSSSLPDPGTGPGTGPTGGTSPPPKKEPPPDAGVTDVRSSANEGDCTTPMGPGDLAVVEMMIATVKPGTGEFDYGEWFEVENTRKCRMNVKGIHIESPRVVDSDVDTLDVTDDLWLKPNETFIVADTTDLSIPQLTSAGRVLAWNPYQELTTHDTLKDNGHDAIVISVSKDDRTQLERVDWDSTDWDVGTNYLSTVAFSVGCTWPERMSWANWAWANKSYYTGPESSLYGTPNAANNDVVCPHLAVK